MSSSRAKRRTSLKPRNSSTNVSTRADAEASSSLASSELKKGLSRLLRQFGELPSDSRTQNNLAYSFRQMDVRSSLGQATRSSPAPRVTIEARTGRSAEEARVELSCLKEKHVSARQRKVTIEQRRRVTRVCGERERRWGRFGGCSRGQERRRWRRRWWGVEGWGLR